MKKVNGYEIKPKANLRDANLRYANLKGADLMYANLMYANLIGANLRDANLSDAALRDAYLRDANLRFANLMGAKLRGANLRFANLMGANLRFADLMGADLKGADLKGADLMGADLKGADLKGAKLPDYSIVPECGSFYGFKKTTHGVIKILIPSKAERVSTLVGRKCRASHVKVISGEGVGGTSPTRGGAIYHRGEAVHSDKFDDDIRVECTHGIHFFLTKAEAEAW